LTTTLGGKTFFLHRALPSPGYVQKPSNPPNKSHTQPVCSPPERKRTTTLTTTEPSRRKVWEILSYLDPNKGGMLKTVFSSEKLLPPKWRRELERSPKIFYRGLRKKTNSNNITT